MSEGPGVESGVESWVGTGYQAIAAGDWCGARDAFSAVLGVAGVPEELKTGAPVRGELVAKDNRLLEIAAAQPAMRYGIAGS